MFSKEAQALAKPCYEAIKKISKGNWEWEPEVGEWYISSMGIIHLISEHPELVEDYIKAGIESIPLLHWERIEQILEGMGYRLTVGVDPEVKPFKTGFECWIGTQEGVQKYEQFAYLKGIKTRQEAVMRAVIELGKGI